MMLKLIKLPIKLVLLPIIAIIFLACKLIKAATHLSCYIVGPGLVLTLIFVIFTAVNGRWQGSLIFGAIGVGAFGLLFLTTVATCFIEDFNGLLVKFVRS